MTGALGNNIMKTNPMNGRIHPLRNTTFRPLHLQSTKLTHKDRQAESGMEDARKIYRKPVYWQNFVALDNRFFFVEGFGKFDIRRDFRPGCHLYTTKVYNKVNI